ncbi:MAG TPA: ABC transporter permease [Actinomycetes bacterium]|jgi:ABC transporter DrrB family efflux protein|nr:ABC transporter permease [Actinomycetes bacterium]
MATIASTVDRKTAGPAASTLAVARRAVLRYLRTPQLIVLGTVQGAMFLLIFRYVFGGAIDVGAIRYVDFLVPGFVTTGVLFTGMSAATAMAEDLEQGFIDRLRSLPIPRSSVLAGRATADTAMHTWSLAITVSIGFAVGFRLHGTMPGSLAAFGLLIAFGFAFEWLFITLGLFAGTAQAAQGMALLVFPLTFVSSAYVPVESMSGWMQPFAQHQPLTYMVDAVRALTQGPEAEALLGHPAVYFVTRALLWAAGIVVVFAPVAVARYRRG